MAPAKEGINSPLDLLFVGISIQPGTKKLLDFCLLVGVIRQGFLPIGLGNPLFVERLLGSGQTVALGNAGVNHLLGSSPVVHQMQILHPGNRGLGLLRILALAHQPLLQILPGHAGSGYDSHRPHFGGHLPGGFLKAG